MFRRLRKASKKRAGQEARVFDYPKEAKEHLIMRHRIACESGVVLAYRQAACRAAEDGLLDLYEEYTALADEAQKRRDDLEALDQEHARRS